MVTNKPEKYIKFVIYFVVLVLINIAGVTLFFRMDLTGNKIYSLSDESKEVVSNLSEPLTINIFFTKNLPAPHNNTERYLHDILEEYSIHSNKFFNFKFYDMRSQENGTDEATKKNQEMAKNYGINSLQIQAIEKDEIKFIKAYMGLVLIHGDVIEKIPAITSTEGLEYKLTMAIKKLNNKISALVGLPEKIKIKLFMSSSLNYVAPYMGLKNLSKIPGKVEESVEILNKKSFNKLDFKYFDPSKDKKYEAEATKYNIMVLKWNNIPKTNIRSGKGTIGLIIEYKDKVVNIPVLNVIQIPIIGTRYELINLNDIEGIIGDNVETVIDINGKIGYLSSHDTLQISSPPVMNSMMQQQGSELKRFNSLISKSYSIDEIDLENKNIPESLKCLIIASPKKEFIDFELFKIDQALMKGTNLALFIDSFKEVNPPRQQQFGMNRGPVYIPLDTGLERLLNHYGINIKKSYVLDKNCFSQSVPKQFGGGKKEIYFAPIIQNKYINKNLDIMKNIKGLITIQISPLKIDEKKISENKLTAIKLISSSDKSWEMMDRIDLNPMFLRAPDKEDEMESKPLSYLVKGEFKSYFDGKPIPEKEIKETDNKKKKEAPKQNLSDFKTKPVFISKSKPAKIFILGSSKLLGNNMLDDEGESPNATFVMNIIDHLNNRDNIALMRSKKQSFNPLVKTNPFTKTILKTLNIAGLPVLMIFFGLLVWVKRNSKRKQIKMIFDNKRGIK